MQFIQYVNFLQPQFDIRIYDWSSNSSQHSYWFLSFAGQLVQTGQSIQKWHTINVDHK